MGGRCVEKMSLSIPFVISTCGHEPESCVVYFGFLANFLMVRMLSAECHHLSEVTQLAVLGSIRGIITENEVLTLRSSDPQK